MQSLIWRLSANVWLPLVCLRILKQGTNNLVGASGAGYRMLGSISVVHNLTVLLQEFQYLSTLLLPPAP